MNHLSKHLIVSSESAATGQTDSILKKRLNVAQIYESSQKLSVKSFDLTKNLATYKTLEGFQNLSEVLFPQKGKNLNGNQLHVAYEENDDLNYDGEAYMSGILIPISKQTFFLKTVAQKLNAKLVYNLIHEAGRHETMTNLINEGKLDFHVNYVKGKYDLESYNYIDSCFLVPLTPYHSIVELILFLPMDGSCWMWLGITIAASTLVWRVLEGHWGFPFGAFAFFVGQSQLIIRVQT